ncbi:LOG family protein [Acetobacter lambici]|uniref:Cytokinin riboside 5'-monophosphate phosphoribohydrolase n=1 Tax=Acetobacter lambici TaxID=1332824 RepID=A0ABT1EZ45_9PROT|nr:TIGR00730 family Rossman fold protein [Acetobacter lambici]MCP1258218.1 TIGR00730 family Rossman fold protein [Acetobacter lambici]
MRRICVFCGSSAGRGSAYLHAAEQLGLLMAQRGIGLVYGGASVGLMGAVANAVLAGGGQVTGVIPQALVEREVAHNGLEDLRVVGSMHERKALMADLSDAFIALPGGIGTLEELFEVWTWTQLGNHAKPCGVLNVNGFYSSLGTFLDHVVEEGFLKPAHRAILQVGKTPEDLLDGLARWHPPQETKWIAQNER